MTIKKCAKTCAKLSRPYVASGGEMLYAGSVAVTAGQELKIETSPKGDELLDLTCPEGKTWTVVMRLQITETDA
jgi:hypothetical protein